MSSGRPGEPAAYKVAIPERARVELRTRVAEARWPEQPAEIGWELGGDYAYLRELCAYWADAYDWGRLEAAFNRFANRRFDGLHYVHRRAAGEGQALPVLLIHGWPGGPHEFFELIEPLAAAGHEVIVPSLPGFGFSAAPSPPANVAAVAGALRELMSAGLGHQRYAVQGGDWGTIIGARMAFDDPDAVVALHLNSPGVLPIPADLSEPPMTEAEQHWAQAAGRWRIREGFHLIVQAAAPDALAVGLADSPVGLAAWLVDKYRRWSDCDGEVERSFSKDQLCDFLTLYWATETIAPSMRLYGAEARSRWRLQPGERIEVPTAVADFPAELLRPQRAWSERVLADLRRWSEFERGGHFAALEQPELLADDLITFLAAQP